MSEVVSWPLDVSPTSASRARELVAAHCVSRHPHLDRRFLQTPLLLVSELVTNAVRHGAGPLGLEVSDDVDRFRVDVSDRNPALPVLRSVDLWSEGGRGIMLVDELAEAWGVVEHPGDGKTVWFQLPPFTDPA